MHLARETIKAEKRVKDVLPNEGLEDGPDEYVVPQNSEKTLPRES